MSCFSSASSDGCGFPADVRPGSNGLRSMRARAAMLGGQLEIGERGDGPGTVVTLDVPLDGAPGREAVAPPAGMPAAAGR